MMNDRSYYIGAKKNDEQKWTWSDGNSWVYDNWGSGQPDGVEAERCAIIHYDTTEENKEAGWWDDIICDNQDFGYVCSYNNCKFKYD